MNNQNNQRAGLVCRIVRRWESSQGPSAGHSRFTERHLRGCEACQEFFAEDLSFEEMLRTSARTQKTSAATLPSVGFEQRILRAVRESQTQPAIRRTRPLAPKLWLAGTFAAAAVAFVFLQRETPTKPGTEHVASQPVAPTATGEIDPTEVASSAIRWLDSLDARRSALDLVEKNPLQQEINSVSANAKSVMDFLVLNFLPANPNHEVTNPTSEAHQG